MDERIRFETKEESNARRTQAFLALPQSERMEWFLRSFDDALPEHEEPDGSKGNFIIRKRGDAVR